MRVSIPKGRDCAREPGYAHGKFKACARQCKRNSDSGKGMSDSRLSRLNATRACLFAHLRVLAMIAPGPAITDQRTMLETLPHFGARAWACTHQAAAA
jgi:hypothetical protein